MYFSPSANKIKLKYAQDLKACWSFDFELKLLNTSKYSIPGVRCVFVNVFGLVDCPFSIIWHSGDLLSEEPYSEFTFFAYFLCFLFGVLYAIIPGRRFFVEYIFLLTLIFWFSKQSAKTGRGWTMVRLKIIITYVRLQVGTCEAIPHNLL